MVQDLNLKIIKLFFIIFVLFFITACQIKRGGSTYRLRKQIKTPVFVELPSNKNVFENISSLIYDSVVAHFQRVGYKISTNPANAYSLQITVKNLDPIQKYVSPDILLYHSTIKLELYCQLLNYKKDVVAEKVFHFDQLISKPQNPALSTDFLIYEYKRMLWRAAPKIEQYFKKFMYQESDE